VRALQPALQPAFEPVLEPVTPAPEPEQPEPPAGNDSTSQE
jgi:hypothetical protein